MTAVVKGISATAGGSGGSHAVPPLLTTWLTTGTVTAPLPAGGGAPVSGDLMLLPVFVRNLSRVINLTSGWTLKSGDNDTAGSLTSEVQGKVAGGAESNPTAVSDQVGTQATAAIAIVVSGWSGTLSDVVVTAFDSASSVNNNAPAGTATVDDCLVLRVYLAGDDNAITTPPTGHTQLFYEISQAGSDCFFAVYSQNAPANTGAVAAANLVMGGSDPWHAYTIIIPPAATAAGFAPPFRAQHSYL